MATYVDVDLVYTWANPSDSEKGRQRSELASRVKGSNRAYRVGSSRTRDNGELRTSIRSALKHLPFLRQIFVVTSGRPPDWLRDARKVVIVQEDSILPPAVRPTFQSTVLEAYVHRIVGLSEHYLYSNDDFLFAAQHDALDFFDEKGRCIVGVGEAFAGLSKSPPVYMSMELNSARALRRHIKAPEFAYFGPPELRGKRFNHLRSRLKAIVKGVDLLNVPTHVAHPYLKSPWPEFHHVFSKEIAQNGQYKFRCSRSFLVNEMYHHFLRSSDQAVFVPEGSRHVYLDWTKSQSERLRLTQALQRQDGSVTRFCLNDHVCTNDAHKAGWDEYVDEIFSLLAGDIIVHRLA